MSRRECPRCGFAIEDVDVGTGKPALRAIELFEQHTIDCPTRPDAATRRKLKRELGKPWIARDPKARVEVANRILKEAAA